MNRGLVGILSGSEVAHIAQMPQRGLAVDGFDASFYTISGKRNRPGSPEIVPSNRFMPRGVTTECESMIGNDNNSGGGDRTRDTRLMKPLL